MSTGQYLGLSEPFLAAHGAGRTAREIAQQPQAWQQTQTLLSAQREPINEFLAPLLAAEPLRIILTGAGTSAYIGQCLAPELLVGSSRVDLQACKLEYSIVSPK